MKLTLAYFLLCAATVFSSSADGYRILGVFPFSAKSHNIVFEALMKGLAQHGHQVDVVSHFPLKSPVENYTDIISLDGTMEKLVNNYSIPFVLKATADIVPLIGGSYGNRLCHFMGFDDMQKLIKNPPKDPPYDLVITEVSYEKNISLR